MNKRKRYSTSYIETIEHKTEEGRKKIAMARDLLKHMNLASGVPAKRLVLMGRLGKNNPNAVKYRKAAKVKNPWGYRSSAYQYIKLDDAAYVDMYMYDKK